MIIGIVGKARAGKDTIASHLHRGYGFTQYSFAQPLKNGVKEMFGFTDAQLFGKEKDIVDTRWGISPRQVLQHLGTDYIQFSLGEAFPQFKETVGRNFWVKKFEDWFRSRKSDVVISDCRFKHEIDAITSMGGEIWCVKRNVKIENSEHLSETEWEKYVTADTFTLENNGTYEELQYKIDVKMNTLGKDLWEYKYSGIFD
jgi:hypothetical protein